MTVRTCDSCGGTGKAPGYEVVHCTLCGGARHVPVEAEFVRVIREASDQPTLSALQALEWLREMARLRSA